MLAEKIYSLPAMNNVLLFEFSGFFFCQSLSFWPIEYIKNVPISNNNENKLHEFSICILNDSNNKK